MKVFLVLPVFAALSISSVSAATTITVDSVDQNWPWSADVRVGFTLSGLSGAVDVDVEVFSGGTSLGKVAASGDVMSLAADGSYSLSFDPTTLGDGSNPVIGDMVVKLATVATDPSWSVPLYRIYDLTQEDAAVEIVTPAKLLAGEYGEWKWTCPEPTLAAGEGVPYTNLVWTGVNQDVYKTSKLVMRYLPAKGDTVRICTMNESYTMPDSFYVGVFETTQKQWENVMGEAAACTFATTTSTGDRRPVETVTYKQVRGHSSDDYWPQAPASGSFISALRAKTSDTPFDLPAAYQLTYAAEAGSGFGTAGSSFKTSTWPDGTPTVEVVDGVTITNAAPGRYRASSTATVGSFAPSVQGLYDVIGNVSEMCVDWHFESQGAQRNLGAVANVDPENPARPRTPSGSTSNRTRTGSDYSESQTYRNSLNYARGSVTPTKGSATIGFRLYLPAYGDEETGSAGGSSSVAESLPVAVFVRPDETTFWRTATNSTFEVSWAFPSGASKATLSVAGMGASRIYPNLTATSQVVELPEGEDVCELTLAFDDGTVETAKLGVVRGAQEGAAATVDYVNAANRAWRRVGPHAVFPVPHGATSITVDGATTALDGACGWFGYVYPSEASSSSVALAAAGGVYDAELRPVQGAVLIVR